MKRLKWLYWLGGVLLVLIMGTWIALKIVSDPLPEGQTGAEADRLANQMMDAVNKAAWDTTGAISWTFGGSSTQDHLWDKDRHYARVNWGENEVYVDINQRKGVAFVNGQKVEGEQADELVDSGWKKWVNDAFWLNPVVKAFDGGTERRIVKMEDGSTGLMISYTSGGATPGDSYLWALDENNRPTSWKMWVSIIPIGGLELSWEDWMQLPTGAWVAQSHKTGSMNIAITNIEAAATLDDLIEGDDPFAVLNDM